MATVRSLPVVQNWDCHECGECCKSYHIRVTDAERARIDGQGWAADPDLKGVELFVWDKDLGTYRLNHADDEACVFLGPDRRCRIHAKFGSAAKPMACRVYPFMLVPAGDHWRVGLRFACPSAAKNLGRPLAEQTTDARMYAGLLEQDTNYTPADSPPPELQPGQPVSWPDLLRFAKAFSEVLAEPGTPIDYRLRKLIALAALCKQSRFDKVSGGRLKEFLEVVSAAIGDEVPASAAAVPPPGWVGRMIFRQVAAVYTRRDTGVHIGVARRGRWTRIRAAWRFARGRGPVPRLHGLMPETTFAAAEQPAGPLSQEADELLTRYYRVKIESLQFCGPTNFRRRVWDGLDSLILTFPVILWLSRVLAANGERSRDEAVTLAVQIVDDNFGFNTRLGDGKQIWATQALAARGELARLVAWYAR
jgi:lysine-N-methylase